MKDDARDDVSSVLGLDAPGASRRGWSWRAWSAAVVVAAVALIVVVRLLGGPGGGGGFLTVEVVKGRLLATVTATGTLQPVNTVDLGPEISGQIKTVLVDFNDRVTAGQVLAVMDTDNLRSRVLNSRASLAAARARVADARATAAESRMKLERTKELYSRGNASKQALDSADAADARARAGILNADAQVEVAQANLATEETNLSKAEIRSPINGIVLSRAVEPGQVVAATFQTPVLFKLAEDLTKMELLVDVDEADIGSVREGQTATFQVDAFQDRQFPAKITQVRFAPHTVDNVVTYQAVLSVSNDDLVLRPGMTATAIVTTATREDATVVPNAALRFKPPTSEQEQVSLFNLPPPPENTNSKLRGVTQHVWTLERGDLKEVEVKVGVSDGQRTELVESPFKPGDRVVVGVQKPAP